MKYLAIEFSNKYHNQFKNDYDVINNQLMFEKIPYYNIDGLNVYNEIPMWMCHIAGIVETDNGDYLEAFMGDSLEDTINYIINHSPEFVFFSVMESTKDIITQIINRFEESEYPIKFVLGRTDIPYTSNVIFVENMVSLNKKFNLNKIYDIILPVNLPIFKDHVTRVTTINNCTFHCIFCVAAHGKLEILSDKIVKEQFTISKHSKYIYIGNLTFGLSFSNEIQKLEQYKENKEFIIQTNAKVINSLNSKELDRLYNNNVKYIELGVETFNDDILTIYNKPSTVEDNISAIIKLFERGFKVIPNIIINIQGETKLHYTNTLNNLHKLEKYLYYMNLFNFSKYNTIDSDERILIKSWNKKEDNIIDISIFNNTLYEFNKKLFNRI